MSSSLPVESLRQAIPFLRRPFTPEAVKWKIQTNPRDDNGNAMIVCFIDARLVSERLNAVCPDLWETSFEQVPGGMLCKLTIDARTRADVGFSDVGNGVTDISLKALYSDAFKRAAVHFGVGAFLYALPRVYLNADELKKVTRGQKTLWFLPPAVEPKLRNGYRDWLEGTGKTAFGEPLSHGDEEDAQGDVETELPATPAEEQKEQKSNGSRATSKGDAVSDGQAKFAHVLKKKAGLDDDSFSVLLKSRFEVESGRVEDLPWKRFDQLKTFLESPEARLPTKTGETDVPADTDGLPKAKQDEEIPF